MFYHPNFCCNCGEKIERAEWPLTASRKFCDLCASENQGREWLQKILIVFGMVVFLAALSSFFRPAARSSDSEQKHSNLIATNVDGIRTASNSNTTPRPSNQSHIGTLSNIQSVPANVLEANLAAAAKKVAEPVYYCGAMTKKGAPCTRRVKRPGERCWQHVGMPAMSEVGTATK